MRWFQNYHKHPTYYDKTRFSIIRSKWHILHSIRVTKSGTEICLSMCGFISEHGRIAENTKNKDFCTNCRNLFTALRDTTEIG